MTSPPTVPGTEITVNEPALAPAVTDDTRTDLVRSTMDRYQIPDVLNERPYSIREQIEYSHHGDWSPDTGGAARALHMAWTCVVAIPVSVLAELLRWVHERPARAVVFWPVFLLVTTALSFIPTAGDLIPSIFNITTWF